MMNTVSFGVMDKKMGPVKSEFLCYKMAGHIRCLDDNESQMVLEISCAFTKKNRHNKNKEKKETKTN